MITVEDIRKRQIRLGAPACPREEKPAPLGKMICWQAHSADRQFLLVDCDGQRILFPTNEAGMLLKTKDSRGNLRNEAGMFMKTSITASALSSDTTALACRARGQGRAQ
jgi:hypothetical protein